MNRLTPEERRRVYLAQQVARERMLARVNAPVQAAEVVDQRTRRLLMNAGLFSTARDLARFARMMLNGGTLDGATIVAPHTIQAFTRVQNPSLSHRALGWETANGANSGGHRLSSRAFGHTGFTGTSIWIDPVQDVFILLLSNRVNPTRERRGIFAVRVALADAVLSVMGSQAAEPAAQRRDPKVSWYPPRPVQGSLLRISVTRPQLGTGSVSRRGPHRVRERPRRHLADLRSERGRHRRVSGD